MKKLLLPILLFSLSSVARSQDSLLYFIQEIIT